MTAGTGTGRPHWTLDHLEATFQGVVLGESPRETLLPAIAQPNADGARVDKADLLNIYASGYVARREEVLGENFEGLHTLMGDDEFSELCHAYLRSHPSHVRSVRWTGHRLAEYLRETQPWADHPVLADMAAFDWAQGETFDAPGRPDDTTPPIDEAAMTAVAPALWPGLRFAFQDALRTAEITFDVDRFFQQMQANPDGLSAPEKLDAPRTVLFWRDPETLAVKYRATGENEAAVLKMARAGHPFADLCDVIAAARPAADAALDAAIMVQTWVDHGLIAGIKT